MHPVPLDGTRIYLREFQPDDLDDSMAIVGGPDVTTFLSFDTRTRDEQGQRLTADIERARTAPRPDYYLAVVAKDTDRLIGFFRIGLIEPTDWQTLRSGEIGAASRKDRWRQGYVTEATGERNRWKHEAPIKPVSIDIQYLGIGHNWCPAPEIREIYRLSEVRISSAVFFHTNGLGSAFHSLIQSRMSFSKAWTFL